MPLFGSAPTMIFDGVSQPPKPSVEAGRPVGDAKSAKAKKAKKAKKAGKAPANEEVEASKNAAKVSAGTPAVVSGESPSVPKQSKKPAADKAADKAAEDATAGGVAGSEDGKKPTRKQRAAEERAERDARTVFVGNLPAQFGAVDSVRIRSAAAADPSLPKKAAVITHALDRQIRDSYNAYVVFAEASSVARAVATNGALFEGRHLRIDRLAGVGAGSSAPSTHDLKRSVFLGNLPFNVQEEALHQQLSCCGEIENVRLVRDAATQHGKGFGYILFKEAGAVEIAIGLHEKISLPGPNNKPRAVRIFRCIGAKSNKRARETASAAEGNGRGPIGRTGAAGGYLERARQRLIKQTSKEIKPRMSAAAKLKKERKEKVQRKRDHKEAKRRGGKLASGIGKKTAAKAAAAKKSAKKPSKM